MLCYFLKILSKNSEGRFRNIVTIADSKVEFPLFSSRCVLITAGTRGEPGCRRPEQ